MEEDSGVKAPLTRLRRRLSVEQSDDVKSPGPATPTTKRGGRLAAKPQLELIDEHAANITPTKRSTRKASAKETVAAEEKTVTPSRRSTRIKSNTSIVSETAQSYESPRTRRAARRLSQAGSDSESSVTPRQTRRTRKDSASSVEKLEIALAGKPNITEVIIEEENISVKSDDTVKGSESSSSTSVRKSPRLKEKQEEKKNRKSIDQPSNKVEETDGKTDDILNVSNHNEKTNRKSFEQTSNVINDTKDYLSKEQLNVTKPIRKNESNNIEQSNAEVDRPNDHIAENTLNVPTQNQNSEGKSIVSSSDDDAIVSNANNTKDILNVSKDLIKEKTGVETSDHDVEMTYDTESKFDAPKEHKGKNSKDDSNFQEIKIIVSSLTHDTTSDKVKDNLSDSILMIKDLDEIPKRKSSTINKSASALDKIDNFESKRQRTKSWTASPLNQGNEEVFLSDNETAKKKLKKQTSKELKKQSKHSGSGDNENEKSNVQNTSELNSSPFRTKRDRTSKDLLSPNQSLNMENTPIITEIISPKGNKENILISPDLEKDTESSVKFFEKTPTAVLQSIVYFEDSDADTKDKEINVLKIHSEDQCVPVIDNKLVEDNIPAKSNENNSVLGQKNDDIENSCEPMDVDETIPNNESLTELNGTKLHKSADNSKQKSVLCSPLVNNSMNNISVKSKQKSSLSRTETFEKNETENRSTLILSQLKDVSSTEHNVSKAPKLSNENLSKSIVSAISVKDKNLDLNNVSQDYSTSTPLQQKLKKIGMQINSSIIDSSNHDNEKEKSLNNSKKELPKISVPYESSSEDNSDLEDEENTSNEKSHFLDDEAEEASDDYESGDSRDDDERRYEDENEIVEKGETLDSEDTDFSDESEYEKDSFVVNSHDEDDELLSGSGDDLSMSDKELSYSTKSKKKYDQRKQKEQKKASREMYEARHKLCDSVIAKSKKKNKRQQIDSSEESEEEVVAPVKKNKRLRLDSTKEDDMDKSNTSATKKKSKVKRLSESVCENSPILEQEISTINDGNVTQNNDPLSIGVKLEPKTPMKELNISTIQINENIEEVQVDNNISIIKCNEIEDPLQATMLDEEYSSGSENSEIINNYDSVLNELNSLNKSKKVKSHDISLNLNQKTKQNLKEPIIDQLNLTNTKNKKTVKKYVDFAKLNESQDKETRKAATADPELSSDSIDFKLLFSEDSNDHEYVKDKSAKIIDIEKKAEEEDFIPLKKSPGKMNILGGGDNASFKTEMNESMKKKNKTRKSRGAAEEEIGDDQTSNNDIQIIIDTTGTYGHTNSSSKVSLTCSSKKKKNRDSITCPEDNEILNTQADEAPEEVSFKKTKTKYRNTSEKTDADVLASQDDSEKSINVSNSSSAKKNKSLLESLTKQENVQEEPNVSLKTASNKKKKKQTSEIPVDEDIETEVVTNVSLNKSMGSGKKKKQKYVVESTSLVDEEECNKVDNGLSATSAKKQKATKVIQIVEPQLEIQANLEETSNNTTKKRKRKSSANEATDNINNEDKSNNIPNSFLTEESLSSTRQNKKRKIPENEDTKVLTQDGGQKNKRKKRKERDDDDENSVSKIFKENSCDKVLITRLPTSVLNQLEDKPRKEVLELKKSSLVSTTAFVVEETRKRRNKPSKFLEESVYLNDTHVEKKQKGNIKKPKVLPFIPTAITSGSGFTTSFKINIIPQEVKFVAQTKNVVNFKDEYLYGKKIKRLGTYETYKKHRSAKMSKF